MNDDEWSTRRDSAITLAFQTGRPIFADSEGAFRFADGDREEVPIPAPISDDRRTVESPYREIASMPSYTPYERRRAYRAHVAAAPPQYRNENDAAQDVDEEPLSWWTRVKRWFIEQG